MTPTRALTDEERTDWLQLQRSENVGPVTFQRLIMAYGTAKAALEKLPDMAKRGGKASFKLYPRSAAEKELEAARSIGAQHVVIGERGYPALLRHVQAAPPVLCVSGNLDLASQETIAIVGARNASALGRKMTRMLAERFSSAEFAVASGLARGIDTVAHEAAGPSQTIAVVAAGLDHIYPPENAALQRQIAREGLLVSEMPPGTVPKAEHFPRRNRIISGAARAVVVVEAALHSGSLITARFAMEQGRDVFAVPGSPLDPRSAGCNRLIRDGATLVQEADDVLEALKMFSKPLGPAFLEPDGPSAPLPDHAPGDAERNEVLSLLTHSPVAVDDLIRESGLSPDVVTAILLELEVAGRAARAPGGQISLKSN